MVLGFKDGILETISNVTISSTNDQLSMVTVVPASLTKPGSPIVTPDSTLQVVPVSENETAPVVNSTEALVALLMTAYDIPLSTQDGFLKTSTK